MNDIGNYIDYKRLFSDLIQDFEKVKEDYTDNESIKSFLESGEYKDLELDYSQCLLDTNVSVCFYFLGNDYTISVEYNFQTDCWENFVCEADFEDVIY